MAAVIGRLAAAGAKTGGKFATKTVTKKGGKSLAKGLGKVGKKKGLKTLVGGKGGKLKKFAESQLKAAIMSKFNSGCDDEGAGPDEKLSKKPIKIKSPDRRHKSPEKKASKSPSSGKSKKGSKMKHHSKSKSHVSSSRRHDTDDEDDDGSECGRATGRGRSKKRGKSGDSNSKTKKKMRDNKKDKKHRKHHSSEDQSEIAKNKGDERRKGKMHRAKKKKQRSDDDSTASESESTKRSAKRNGKKSSKKHTKQSSEESCSDTNDSEMRNIAKKHHKKAKSARRVDSEDASDASDIECENVAKHAKKGDKRTLSKKKRGKHNTPDDDDHDIVDETKERNRQKRKHKKDKKSGRSDSEFTSSRDEKRRSPRSRTSPTHPRSSDTSSEEEVCVSLRDVRFRKRNRMNYDGRGIDESDCCSQYASPPTHMSMRELCQVIKEVSNGSGSVDVKRLTKSLAKRMCSTTGGRMDGRRNAAGDVRRNLTNSNEEEFKPKKDKQLRAIQNVFAGRKKHKANKNATPPVNTERNPTSQIELPDQTPSKPVSACEDLIDRDFNMMLFKVAKELIMDEYQKKKNCEPEDNDEWLRAFEMVIKFDNAKDIRAAQLRHEEMKLESKYLKKGQMKHFKRSGLGGGGGGGGGDGDGGRDGNEAYQSEVTMFDGGEGGAAGECRRRSKLDHLYDLIYALRGAPRKGGWKKNQLALPSNVDQSAATQLVPVYLPWELPQSDPYSAYYTDSYGYENPGYYQQC